MAIGFGAIIKTMQPRLGVEYNFYSVTVNCRDLIGILVEGATRPNEAEYGQLDDRHRFGCNQDGSGSPKPRE